MRKTEQQREQSDWELNNGGGARGSRGRPHKSRQPAPPAGSGWRSALERLSYFTVITLAARVQTTLSPVIRVTRETHEAPWEIRERVGRAGGTNRYGEANFRVVWGGSRLTWIGGRWTDRDANGNIVREAIELRRVPKYSPVDRWHIERWMPAESYGSPEQWYEQTTEVENGIRIAALGPYPARGEYEHCFTLESASGGFFPMTAGACDWIVRAIEWSRRQTPRERRGAIAAREARRERAWDRDADDLLDDAAPAFHGAPFAGRVAG